MAHLDVLSFVFDVGCVLVAHAAWFRPRVQPARSLAIRSALVLGVGASVLTQHVSMPPRQPCAAALVAAPVQT